jgi:hypothetical protein
MDFTLPSKIYNLIKYLVLIVLPSFTTLYVLLATLWEWDNIAKISASLTGFTAFLGSLVGISSRNFNNSDDRFFGEIHVAGTEEGAQISHQVFNEDPSGMTIADKKEVTFKVVHE